MFAAAFIVVPTFAFADNHELAREPHGIDSPAPEPALPPAAPTQKITIYTAKTIVTLDPGTPTAEAVAVMDGKILGVGTLDEVKGWVTNQEVEIDRRFEDAVIIPGLIEAHMHPQITGVLWLGAYVGRFDRTARPTAPSSRDWRPNRPSSTGSKEAAAKLPNDGSLTGGPSPAPTPAAGRAT